jgi:hypothetical protein
MSVFNGATKIKRNVSDPKTDPILPGPVGLSWDGITSPVALSDTKGVHCELIHGDSCEQINGAESLHVTADQQFLVNGNQTIVIKGKHHETIAKDCYQNIVGPHTVTNHTVRNETRMGPCTTTYGVLTRQDSHEGRMYYANTLYELALDWNFEVSVSKLTLQVIHVEIKSIHIYGSLVDAGSGLIDVKENILKVREKAAITRLYALTTEIDNLKGDIDGVRAELAAGYLMPIDANGTILF